MCFDSFKRLQSVKEGVSHEVPANCKGYTGEAGANAAVLKRKAETSKSRSLPILSLILFIPKDLLELAICQAFSLALRVPRQI